MPLASAHVTQTVHSARTGNKVAPLGYRSAAKTVGQACRQVMEIVLKKNTIIRQF